MAYLDDILIYSDILEEHQIHVRSVLEALSGVGLHLMPKMYEFHKEDVKYLRLIIERGGVKTDPDKVAAVQNCPVSQNSFDV